MRADGDPAVERARAGDAGAFVDLLHRQAPELRSDAVDDALLAAFREAYRHFDSYDPATPLAAWLQTHLDRAAPGEARAAGPVERDPAFWERLARLLAAEAPAFAAPELPERRFPVVPSLQRSRRLKGRR